MTHGKSVAAAERQKTKDCREKGGKTLNGKWAPFVKVTLPVVLVWLGLFTAWQVNETYTNKAFRDMGDRWTRSDALEKEIEQNKRIEAIKDKCLETIAEMRHETDAKIAALPPEDWKKKIDAQGADIRSLIRGQERALTLLEQLQRQMDKHVTNHNDIK